MLVGTVLPAGIVHHDYGGTRTAHEMRVFVVDEDEFRAAVLEDVRDLAVGEASVDGANDSLGSEDAVVGLCERCEGESKASCSGVKRCRYLLWRVYNVRRAIQSCSLFDKNRRRSHVRGNKHDAIRGLNAGLY